VSGTRRFLTALSSALFGSRPSARPIAVPATRQSESVPVRPATKPTPGSDRATADQEPSPGRTGPDATVEIDPAGVRRPGWGYAPRNDGDLDPGEIVWTWVPYEERDGRGKDRPVLIVATLSLGAVLAVQLTSADHTGDTDHVPLGVGPWDRSRRPSWVAIDRVFQVRPDGVRREGTFVDATRYRLVETALRRRYGWR
jgi:hypothetical protein